MIEKLMMRKG